MTTRDSKHDIAIIVLTTDIIRNGSAWVPDDIAYMRMDAAALLYYEERRKGRIPYMIVSGGKVKGRDNPSLADVGVKVAAEEYRIPRRDLYCECWSFNTVENAIFSIRQLKRKNIKDVLIVTNRLHLDRALDSFSMYNRESFRIEGCAAEEIILQHNPEKSEEIERFGQDEGILSMQRKDERHRRILNIPCIGPYILRFGVHLQVFWYGEREAMPIGRVYTPLKSGIFN